MKPGRCYYIGVRDVSRVCGFSYFYVCSFDILVCSGWYSRTFLLFNHLREFGVLQSIFECFSFFFEFLFGCFKNLSQRVREAIPLYAG